MNNDVLNTSIEFLKGVGPNRARLIKDELKISKFKDLLFQFVYWILIFPLESKQYIIA